MHIALNTLQCTVYSTLYSAQCTVYSAQQCALPPAEQWAADCCPSSSAVLCWAALLPPPLHTTLHTTQCTLNTVHCPLHYTLNIAHLTLYTAHYITHLNCTLNTVHCTLHYTLNIAHLALYTAHLVNKQVVHLPLNTTLFILHHKP